MRKARATATQYQRKGTYRSCNTLSRSVLSNLSYDRGIDPAHDRQSFQYGHNSGSNRHMLRPAPR
ncbi:uncharacterized protein RAG0_05985 [Rhynchosporium agropyri]|uniref:Uncharacterized protein n=1 Tax=Rhynchosporium agropyri TaxID=914238 RepID=A0A1E1KFJ1_9HELO|nr:uncharacterized protein RAG0_05985 [Rhynchosporium agropyri]